MLESTSPYDESVYRLVPDEESDRIGRLEKEVAKLREAVKRLKRLKRLKLEQGTSESRQDIFSGAGI